MAEPRISINGWLEPATAFGLADAKIKMTISQGTPPYGVNVRLNDDPEIYRNIGGIEPGPNNGDVLGLPPGIYNIEAYDSSDPVQTCQAMVDWVAIAPPYATLNGTVNAMGISTTVEFEYGLTSEYDHTASAGISNGNIATNISLRLSSGGYDTKSNLLPGTLYHYRIKATNTNGTAYGNDMTFTTPSVLPIVQTLAATNIS